MFLCVCYSFATSLCWKVYRATLLFGNFCGSGRQRVCINCCSCSSVAGRHCVYCYYLLLPARYNDQPFPLLLFMLLCKKDLFCFPCIHFCISFALLVDTSGGSGLYYVIFSFLLLCFTMHKLTHTVYSCFLE